MCAEEESPSCVRCTDNSRCTPSRITLCLLQGGGRLRKDRDTTGAVGYLFTAYPIAILPTNQKMGMIMRSNYILPPILKFGTDPRGSQSLDTFFKCVINPELENVRRVFGVHLLFLCFLLCDCKCVCRLF